MAFLRIAAYVKGQGWNSAAIDFRNPYVAQSLFLEKKNFYDDSLFKTKWTEISVREKIFTNEIPGFPALPFLYPPWTATLFAPFHLLPSYRLSTYVWVAINITSLMLIVLFVIKFFAPGSDFSRNFWILLAIAIAYKSTMGAIHSGQPAILCLALSFAALYLVRQKKNIFGGVLLGLACFKFTLALPFFIFLLLEKQWKALIIATFVPLLLFIATLLYVENPVAVIQTYFETMQRFRSEGTPDSAFNLGMMTEFGEIIYYIFGTAQNVGIIYGLLWCSVGYVIWKFGFREQIISHDYIFIIVAAAALVLMYHLMYDALILLPLYFIQKKFPPSWQKKVYLALFMCMIPLTFLRSQLPEIIYRPLMFLHPSLCLFALFLIILLYPVAQFRRIQESTELARA